MNSIYWKNKNHIKLISLLFSFSLTSAISSSQASGQCLNDLIDIKASNWRDQTTQPIFSRLKTHTQPPSKITIHYTGVRQNPNLPVERKLKGLFGFSTRQFTSFKKALWGDIPYNFYLDVRGHLAEGRSLEFKPDTNTPYNPDGHITVVVEAGPGDPLNPAQKAKLFSTIKALQDRYNIPTSGIGTHNHYASTSCPGPEIEAAVSSYKESARDYRPKPVNCKRLPIGAAPIGASGQR